jgi:hypothetical protein
MGFKRFQSVSQKSSAMSNGFVKIKAPAKKKKGRSLFASFPFPTSFNQPGEFSVIYASKNQAI